MKRAAPFAVLLLLGCGEAEQPAANTANTATAAAAPAPPPRERAPEPLSTECAIGGAAFARSCMVDQAEGEDGVTLTIRHPDGGFRRLLVTPEGEIAAADGAEAAETALLTDGRVEVAIGGDLYRIPAPAGFAARQGP